MTINLSTYFHFSNFYRIRKIKLKYVNAVKLKPEGQATYTFQLMLIIN